MAKTGQITIRGRDFAKMQLRAVEQVLNGESSDTLPVLGRQQKAQQQLVF